MPDEFNHIQAYQHIEKGQQLESLGLLDEAMLEFKRAVEADPRIATAHNALGHHYQRKGLLTKAADEFRSAVRLSGDYESCFSLGRVLTELERYEEAVEAFRQCLVQEPNDPSARYELGYALCALGQFDEALAHFQALSQEYPEDWELKFAQADCYMGKGDYEQAERLLIEAWHGVPPNEDTSQLGEALLMVRRHMEFAGQTELGLKDRLYRDFGVICLGSGRDNGLDIPIYEGYTFTYKDVAVTTTRLMKLIRAHEWEFTAVISMDEDSLPLAIVLSQLLQVPMLGVEELREDDFVLAVTALATNPELYEVIFEHVPGRMLSFALSLNWPLEEGLVTDIIGVQSSGDCVLPWKRIRKRSPEAAATSILRALAILPEEDNECEQIAYYTQEHKLLRFFDYSEEFAQIEARIERGSMSNGQ
ncbi:MAG: tetratricopeptide repeat protein [Chloroflexi bacterium]|nr:tetratricopeptide repeat protein [Chloroflexota bacterium]